MLAVTNTLHYYHLFLAMLGCKPVRLGIKQQKAVRKRKHPILANKFRVEASLKTRLKTRQTSLKGYPLADYLNVELLEGQNRVINELIPAHRPAEQPFLNQNSLGANLQSPQPSTRTRLLH